VLLGRISVQNYPRAAGKIPAYQWTCLILEHVSFFFTHVVYIIIKVNCILDMKTVLTVTLMMNPLVAQLAKMLWILSKVSICVINCNPEGVI